MAEQGFSSKDPFKNRDTAAGFGSKLRSGIGTTIGSGSSSDSNGSSRRSRSSGGNKAKRLAREKAARDAALRAEQEAIEKERVAVERAAQNKLIQERKDRSIAAADQRIDTGAVAGGQERFYLPGGQVVSPTYGLGAGGTQTTVGTFKTEEDSQILRSVETAIVPSLVLERTTYLPTPEDKKKYINLLEKSKYNPVARFKLDRFVKNQEEKLELDVRQANIVNKLLEDKSKRANAEADRVEVILNTAVEKIQGKIDTGEISFKEGSAELNNIQENASVLLNKLQSDISGTGTRIFDRLKYAQVASGGRGDQFGTGYDIALSGAETYKKEGKKVVLPFGDDISGRAAVLSLKAGTEAYKAEKVALAFQLGGAALGVAGIAAPAITGGKAALTALKVASAVSTPALALSFGGLVGAKEFERSGDIGLSLAAAGGTAAGFLGAVYSKQIFEAPGNLGKWIDKKFPDSVSSPRAKRGEFELFRRKGGSRYAQQELAKLEAQKVKMTEKQALNEFRSAYKSRSDQIKVIEGSLKGKVYASQADLSKDLSKWKLFLRKAGLTDIQITDRLKEVAIKYQARMLMSNYNKGLITEQQFADKSKKLSELLQKVRLQGQQLTIQSQQVVQEQYTLTEATTLQATKQIQIQKLLTLCYSISFAH